MEKFVSLTYFPFQDPLTGGVTETFETPYTKAQMIGGRQPVSRVS